MMSAPTMATSSSGSLFTSPGFQLAIVGSTLRLCSGAAYLSAKLGAANIADRAASDAAAIRVFFMGSPRANGLDRSVPRIENPPERRLKPS